jgi:hypothetical protein
MTRRQILMIGGLAASAALAVFGDRTPGGSATVEAMPHAAGPAAASPVRHKRAAMILALQPRDKLIAHAFPDQPPTLFGVPAAGPAPAADPVAAAEPEAPVMPFLYLGKKFENGKWEVYLAIGDQTYFAREGSVLDQTYVVNAIRPPLLTLTYMPKQQRQTVMIGGED